MNGEEELTIKVVAFTKQVECSMNGIPFFSVIIPYDKSTILHTTKAGSLRQI